MNRRSLVALAIRARDPLTLPNDGDINEFSDDRPGNMAGPFPLP